MNTDDLMVRKTNFFRYKNGNFDEKVMKILRKVDGGARTIQEKVTINIAYPRKIENKCRRKSRKIERSHQGEISRKI